MLDQRITETLVELADTLVLGSTASTSYIRSPNAACSYSVLTRQVSCWSTSRTPLTW